MIAKEIMRSDMTGIDLMNINKRGTETGALGWTKRVVLILCFVLFSLTFCVEYAFAKDSGVVDQKNTATEKSSNTDQIVVTMPPELEAQAAVLIDAKTGRVLFNKNMRRRLPPASMTKLVTLYLIYDAIYRGKLNKDQVITIPFEGSMDARPPRSSLMRLVPGDQVTLFELMQGTAIASGNDAAYALANRCCEGSVERFVKRMNQTVGNLRLNDLRFVDPDGWSSKNLVSPYHYALFAKNYIERFPYALKELHAVKILTYPLKRNVPDGDLSKRWVRTKKNTNKLLGKLEGVDGLKTGYTDESGYNFCATAKRERTRFIAVVMGIFTETQREGLILRAKECAMLLEYGFANYRTYSLSGISSPPFSVKHGVKKAVWGETGLSEKGEAVLATLSEQERDQLVFIWKSDPKLKAPIVKGERIGEVSFYSYDGLLATVSVIAKEDVEKMTLRVWMKRLFSR